MKLIVLLSVVPVLTAVLVFRTARRWCEHQPGHRPWLIAASFVVLGLVGVLVPKVFELRPPFSESPAGLFVIFARGEALAMVAMAAIATVVAAAITPPPRGVDPAA